MTFLFTDDAFSFEALRLTGYARYGGADLGEVIVTTRQIPDADEAAWHDHWKKPAPRRTPDQRPGAAPAGLPLLPNGRLLPPRGPSSSRWCGGVHLNPLIVGVQARAN